MKKLFIALMLIVLPATAAAAGNYRVTQLRAAPGNLEPLLAAVKEYRKAKNDNVLILRHSQGNHWDIMLMEPAGVVPAKQHSFSKLVNFQHSFLAVSKDKWADFKKQADQNGLFHIEMFNAVAGKHAMLMKQRKMENIYLKKAYGFTNSIFKVTFGSDVDAFTVGIHKNMLSFSAPPKLSDPELEKLAIKAGFKNRADLSFMLRKTLATHQDTLANRVK